MDHGHNYIAANEAFFNEVARKYDDAPHAVERARRTAAVFRKFYDFNEDTTTVLDFACGTGLISRELAPYSKSIVGVDISQGVVDQYNLRAFNQGIPLEEMRAIRADLKGVEGELDGARFDAVVCASAYHHFPSVEEVTKTLAFFLKPGGALLVVDLLKGRDHAHVHDDIDLTSEEQIAHMVPHRGGFGEEAMKRAFEGAGLVSFSFTTAIKAKQGGKDAALFIAKGTNQASS